MECEKNNAVILRNIQKSKEKKRNIVKNYKKVVAFCVHISYNVYKLERECATILYFLLIGGKQNG